MCVISVLRREYGGNVLNIGEPNGGFMRRKPQARVPFKNDFTLLATWKDMTQGTPFEINLNLAERECPSGSVYWSGTV
jgi:hypothetical protein